MRGKKGVIRGSITSQEDKTSNGCPRTNKIENSGLHANDTISVEALIIGDNMSLNSKGSQSMKENLGMANLRRSGRIKNSTLPGGTRIAKPAMEHAKASKNYKEGAPRSQPVSKLPVGKECNFGGGTQVQQDSILSSKLEDKINYLVQAVDLFKSQLFEQPPAGSNEDNSSGFNYKTLYLDSQKKIDALMEENFELVRKLEYARGKIAAYEEMKHGTNATKEVLFLRAADVAALTPQTLNPLTTPTTTAAPSDAAVLPSEKGNSKKRKAGKP